LRPDILNMVIRGSAWLYSYSWIK